MALCKAVVQEGPRKGQGCKFPPAEHGYCGRHERNRLYDLGIQEGKKWCRFFFRGCNTELTTEDVSENEVSCTECRGKLTKKQHPCEHTGCAFKVVEPGFCKNHERDNYRKEEQEKGIKYCDIARGCFTVCSKDKQSCETCLEKFRAADNERYAKRKELTQVLQTLTHTTQRVCTQCGKDFEKFTTRYSKESVTCGTCNAAQLKQDVKRKERVRNYRDERYKNIPQFYKDYVRGAAKRGYDMNLQFEAFSGLVTAECHYCGYKTEGEVNGIDRVDNSIGYQQDNCVTACWTCNRIKHTYDKEFFLDKCKIITNKLKASSDFFKKWKQYYYRSTYRVYSVYKKEAERRGLEFNLSEIQFKLLVKSSCYLCGYQSPKGIGIDRVNNAMRNYTFDNCRPCCGSCNDMKGEIDLQEFLEHCSRIIEQSCYTENITEIVNTPTEILAVPKQAVERTHWKALGLYYAILSNSAHSFIDMYSSVYTVDEFTEVCALIKESTKEQGVKTLQTLLQTLKKRKQRAKA
jgi:5-methylcytosine-specific restriction endonuclease McrA